MGVSILESDRGAVLYCNTMCWAFGPVFESAEKAAEFKRWLGKDARSYDQGTLETLYYRWTKEVGDD